MAETVDILLTIPNEQAQRYHEGLSRQTGFHLHIAHSMDDALDILGDKNNHVDVFVIDQAIGDTFFFLNHLRRKYPRLLVILVDEEADFGMPGQADEFTNEPFKNDDLAKRITKLMSERRMETLRSDSLPAVRNINQSIKKAAGILGKIEASVNACIEQGYDYVAYYGIDSQTPLKLTLKAQAGPKTIQSIAPKEATPDDLMGWVAQNGQSRIAGPEDKPNHILVSRGRLGAISCVPVSFSNRSFGVIAACKDRPGSITQEAVLMLELIAAQLATALTKETK
jgi:hypothetical protein